MSFWREQINIGSLSFPRFIGGPLDGITDSPFRQLVRRYSPHELLYTEMRHVGAIASSPARMLRFLPLERPLSYQIAANQLTFLDAACDAILQAGVDIVDLNVGCPASAVVKSGSGSALMADLPRLKAIVMHLRARLPIPFTVKIRAGFKEKNAVDVAKMLADCGVDALAIHPRLQTQKFEGQPDYALAAEVKKAVSIPVIISGGVVNWATAQAVYEATGVDGFLIGRGIWAKPWKLHELALHADGQPFAIDKATMIKDAIDHLTLMLEHYGPSGLFAFRKHLPFYLRGFSQAGIMRSRLIVSPSAEEVRDGLQSLIG